MADIGIAGQREIEETNTNGKITFIPIILLASHRVIYLIQTKLREIMPYHIGQ